MHGGEKFRGRMHGGVGSLLTRQGVAVLSYAAAAECVHDVYLVYVCEEVACVD